MRCIWVIFLCFTLCACGSDDKQDEESLRFIAIGDWGRDGTNNQKELAEVMDQLSQKKQVHFVLTLGDNFYPEGVSSTTDSKWQTSFEQIYTGSLQTIPWYVTLGNHDYYGKPKAEIDYTSRSTRWKLPSYFYTVVFRLKNGGSLRLVVLDTTPFEKSSYDSPDLVSKIKYDTTRQKIWMDSVFNLNDTNWVIVSGHHPLYTGGARVNEPNSVRSALLPTFKKHSLPIYFAGHEHDLQHIQTPDINQFVSGAGSELRPTGNMQFSRFSASTQGIMSVEVTQTTINVYVISYQMDTLYRTQLTKK